MKPSSSLLQRLGVATPIRNFRLHWHAIRTWGMSPLSPDMPRAILRRNELENAR